MLRRQLLQAASAAVALPGLARAQAYPAKPIRYIVPVAAGGGNDMIARVVTERWGPLLGQPFIVDNQSGGGGVIAEGETQWMTAGAGNQLALVGFNEAAWIEQGLTGDATALRVVIDLSLVSTIFARPCSSIWVS
jgi:tripartite-type tricarboxylate transporter receptor subunit TctC